MLRPQEGIKRGKMAPAARAALNYPIGHQRVTLKRICPKIYRHYTVRTSAAGTPQT